MTHNIHSVSDSTVMGNRVRIKLLNLPYYALLDTGASTSIVSKKYVEVINKNCKACLVDVTGTAIPVQGISCLELDLGFGCLVKHTFLVVDLPTTAMILGSDFINNHKLSINFNNRTLTDGISEVPIYIKSNKGGENIQVINAKKERKPAAKTFMKTSRVFYRKGQTDKSKSYIDSSKRNFSGVVKCFYSNRMFGFITRDDGHGDVFFHKSDVTDNGLEFLFNPPRSDIKVNFQISHGKGNLPKARKVKILPCCKITRTKENVTKREGIENLRIVSQNKIFSQDNIVSQSNIVSQNSIDKNNQSPQISKLSNVEFSMAKSGGFFVFERNLALLMLVDCGASCSVISTKIIKSDLVHNTNLYAASGASIKTVGKVLIEIDIGLDKVFCHDFIVADLSTANAILGLDFLLLHQLNLNCPKKNLEHRGGCTKVFFGNLSSRDIEHFCQSQMLDLDYDEQQCDSVNSIVELFDDPILKQSSRGDYTINLISSQDPEPMTDIECKCHQLLTEFSGLTTPPSYHGPAKHPYVLDIKLTDLSSLRQRARPCTVEQRKILMNTFLDLIERNVVVRGSPSHVCPTTIVAKKNGKHRVCVDYTRLNACTEWINYPLPQMNKLTSIVTCEHKVFSVIDLKEAYFSLPLTPEASELAGIITPDGAFLPKRTQFGLRNAPFKFCELVDHVTHGLKHFVYTYLDDFLIFSKSENEHLKHLQQIFMRLESFGLFINKDKCCFAQSRVSFLGREVSEKGIKVEEEKIEFIQQQKPPSTLRQLRSFLGLINHYRPHLPHLSEIASPLTNLLRGPKRVKRAPIPWNNECHKSFKEVLVVIQNAATLAFEDPNLPLILSTDASNYFAGATLEQPISVNDLSARRPLAFFSKALPKSKINRSAFNRELCALRMAIQYFRHRIRGRRLILLTDHKSLVHALTNGTGQHSPIEMAWLDEIKEYYPDVQYIKGSDNVVADFLSRPVKTTDGVRVGEHQLNIITASSQQQLPSDYISVQLMHKTQMDEPLDPTTIKNKTICIRVCPFLAEGGNEVNITGVQCQENDRFRPFVPKVLRPILFHRFHTIMHSGAEKTTDQISSHYYWPGMQEDINHWVKHCPKCQRNKTTRHNRQRLSNFPNEPGRLNIVHLDLVGPLPNNACFQYIITMRDRNTGFLCTAPLPDKTTESVIYAIEQNWVAKFGIPERFITDQGKEFVSNRFKLFCNYLGIEHRKTNAYHPQAQGAIERMHRILNSSLRSLAEPLSWHKRLPYITLQINNQVSGINKFTPNQVVFGRPGRLPGALMTHGNEDPTQICSENIRVFLSVMTFHEHIARPLRDNNPFIEKELSSCSSCWLKDAASSSHLSPLYNGPFEILSRSEKTFVLSINGKPTSVSIDRLKAHRTCDNEDCRTANIILPNDQNDDVQDLDLFDHHNSTNDELDLLQSTSTGSRRRNAPRRFDDFVLY